ncbi:MAG TPA: hypothetical protein VMZ91_04980 [Candidatus Paceibacterota bacterium]|nr:hypothetical protein [Candidatus Paceibacterota bacterium]
MKIIKSLRYIEAKKKKEWDPNPWAVCESTVGKKKDPEKFEDCVMSVKKKQSSSDKKQSLDKKSQAVFTPSLEEELEEKELEKRRKRFEEGENYADPFRNRPSGGRAEVVPQGKRKRERNALQVIRPYMDDIEWNRLVDRVMNIELSEKSPFQ